MNKLKSNLMSILVVVTFVIATLIATFATTASALVAEATTDFRNIGKAGYLIDYGTGSVIYARNENERLPIASMMKIMTVLLTFEAVERNEASFDDDVTVSENASSMGGSQVFLDANTTHKLSDLLRTVIVASANDSCVAIAEHLEGSVEGFVAKMNARAKELGMTDTSFKNCTGLPAPEAYSSAKDVAVMFSKVLQYPLYFDYAKVWLEDYAHPDGRKTTITNTNKLVKFYNGCDGGKTGYTSEAKFCLSATAKRGDMRVIAVVIGADSSKVRNSAVSAMFDYAFANYSNQVHLKAGENIENSVEVTGGKSATIALTVDRDLTQFASKQDGAKFEVKLELPSSVKAPVKAGDCVGRAYLVKDGVIVGESNVVANETVERMSLFDAIGIIGKNWSTQAK